MSGLDWNEIPPEAFAAYQKRLQIVELILEDGIDVSTKRKLREQFLAETGFSARTIQNWLARYIKHGPKGLLFLRPRRVRSPRVRDQKLRQKIRKRSGKHRSGLGRDLSRRQARGQEREELCLCLHGRKVLEHVV